MQHFTAIVLILLATVGTFFARKLSLVGSIAGALIAAACYAGGGWRLLGCLTAFFLLSITATRAGARKKLVHGLAERNGGPRLAGQVLANGAVPAVCALLALIFPAQSHLLLLAAAAGFASATADTLSSEFGNAYGTRYLNLITLKTGTRGMNGMISLEGTIAGLVGSLVPAWIATGSKGTATWFVSIVLAGNLASLFDSFLGGLLENRHLMTNDQVNLSNTAFGAATAVAFYLTFG
jgi:uncharacterized protein (TIGR00297 family)